MQDGWHFTESYPSRAIAKPSSGLPREKRMNRQSSWIYQERKMDNQNKPNTPNSPLPPIKDSGYMDRTCDVTAVGSATRGMLPPHLPPQNPLFYSDWTSRTGCNVSSCFLVHTEHGYLQVCWHVLSFQCVKGKTFDECRLLRPVRPQAKSSAGASWCICPGMEGVCPWCPLKKGQTTQRAQRLWYICTTHRQLLLSAKPWEKTKPNSNKYCYISGSSNHSTFLPRAGCTAGDKCKAFTWLSKHPSSWDTCLHTGGPMAKLLLLIHLSISQEKSFLCTVPLCYLLNKILPH